MVFKIVVLDGSLGGKGGNTGALLGHFVKALPQDVVVDYVELKDIEDVKGLEARMRAAQGFVVASGTYWQSWGSPLQRFFEQGTEWELTDVWLGKPVATLVTMHSVGGVEVMARMQATVNMLGAYVPPLCAMSYSLVNHLVNSDDAYKDEGDVWGLEDVAVVARNLSAALKGEKATEVWGIDAPGAATKLWLKD